MKALDLDQVGSSGRDPCYVPILKRHTKQGTDAQTSYFSFVLHRKRMADHSIFDPSVGVLVVTYYGLPQTPLSIQIRFIARVADNQT